MYSNKIKFNRSHSESDLYISQFDNLSVSSPRDLSEGLSKDFYPSVVRRVYIEEIISPHENRFVNMRRSRFSEVTDDVPLSPETRIKREKDLDKITQDFDEVPMDIDNSFNERFPKIMGTGNFDNSLLPITTINDNNDKIEQCALQERTTRVIHINPVKKKEGGRKWLFLLISIAPILLFCFCFNMTYFFINTEIQVENIEADLVNNVHGHRPLVESIMHVLKTRQNWIDKLKILSFVGSQGVGKTFIANIIKKHFTSNLVQDLYGSQLYYQTEKYKIIDNINKCCLNLIIIDDLKHNDIFDLYDLIDSLPKDSFILLVAIFNVHYTNDNMNTILNNEDIIKIRDTFDKIGIKNDLLVFEKFTSDQIKEWIKKQLFSKNVSLNDQNRILQNILDTHNIEHGLKGLHSKINLELEKQED